MAMDKFLLLRGFKYIALVLLLKEFSSCPYYLIEYKQCQKYHLVIQYHLWLMYTHYFYLIYQLSNHVQSCKIIGSSPIFSMKRATSSFTSLSCPWTIKIFFFLLGTAILLEALSGIQIVPLSVLLDSIIKFWTFIVFSFINVSWGISMPIDMVFWIVMLECYLNHKYSIRKTSELMGVHSRTVSYRLQKIVNLTGMDFDNITEMLAVRNGIIILKILEQL